MITHKGTQQLQTERLLLRKIFPDDAEMVYQWMSDPEVLRYEDWDLHQSVDFTRGFIAYLTHNYESEQTYCWGIQSGEELIGFVMVVDVHEWSGTIAYYLKRNCWSKGYATEAAMAVINYMFSEVGVDRIVAKHIIQNIASGKVLRKVGMHYRGHVKEFEYYSSKSEWYDSDFYAITKEQFFVQNKPFSS